MAVINNRISTNMERRKRILTRTMMTTNNTKTTHIHIKTFVMIFVVLNGRISCCICKCIWLVAIILLVMAGQNTGEHCRRLISKNEIYEFQCPRLFEEPIKAWCCGTETMEPKCCQFEEREKELLAISGKHAKHGTSLTFERLTLLVLVVIFFLWFMYYLITQMRHHNKIHQQRDDGQLFGSSRRRENRSVSSDSSLESNDLIITTTCNANNLPLNTMYDHISVSTNGTTASALRDLPPSYQEALGLPILGQEQQPLHQTTTTSSPAQTTTDNQQTPLITPNTNNNNITTSQQPNEIVNIEPSAPPPPYQV